MNNEKTITVYDGYTSNINYFTFDACFEKMIT